MCWTAAVYILLVPFVFPCPALPGNSVAMPEMRFLLVIHFWTIAPLLSSALQLTVQPWETDRPVPKSIMFFDATRAAGDPQYVDIILADTQRKNSTTMFEKHDLGTHSNAGFRIPDGLPTGFAYVVRMADSAKPSRVLAESSAFQLYSPGTPPSTSQTTSSLTVPILDQITSTAPPLSSPTHVTKKPLPVGAIAGGIVGGVILIILFVVLLYCIRKQGKPLTAEELERKRKLKQKDIISPFIIVEPSPIPQGRQVDNEEPHSSHIAPSPARFHSRKEKTRRGNTAQNYFTPNSIGRLPTEMSATSTIGEGSSQHRRATSSSTNNTSSSPPGRHRRTRSKKTSDTAIATVDELRREKARLDKEITELERRTSVGGSRAHSRRIDAANDEMLAQLATLREQMRVVSIQVPNEPPPDYSLASPQR